jgi:exodeoxyribonuclease VII small subunit
MKEKETKKAITLEERLTRLNEILRQLEQDTIDLEVALELFEEGVQHVKEAEGILNQAELRIKKLVGPVDELEVHQLENDK